MTREITVTVRENSYKISFPNVGQLIDIENMKSILSKGMYSNMENARTIDSQYALNMIDMEAYFSILAPELVEDLKVKSFRDLSIVDSVELQNIYAKKLVPFIKEWRDIISKPIESDDDK